MKELVAIVYDTETTGLIKPKLVDIFLQPQIIEYYAMKVVHRSDGVLEKVDEFETYLKPDEPFNEAIITKITGITNNMVKDAPSFYDIHEKLLTFHAGAHRKVAHNAAFDVAMVKNEVLRLHAHGKLTEEQALEWITNFDASKPLCTVNKTMFFQQRRLTLTNLHQELFGVPFEGAHRARGDVEALFRCYAELVKRGHIDGETRL